MRSGAHRARITLGVSGALVLGLLAWVQPAAQAAQVTHAGQAARASRSPGTTRPAGESVLRAVAKVAAANHRPLARSATSVYFQHSSVVWTGSETAVAVVNVQGDVYLFVRAVNTSEWIQESVAAGFFQNPSLVWTGSTFDIAGTDGQGDLLMWSQSDSGNWQAEEVSTSPTGTDVNQTPAIAVDASSAVVIAEDYQEGVDLFYQLTPGGSWYRETITGNPAPPDSYGPPAIATVGDVIYVTASDYSEIYVWDQGLGSDGWGQHVLAANTTPGNYALQTPAIAVNASNVVAIAATVYLTHTGLGDDVTAVGEWSQAFAGSGWVAQTVASGSAAGAYAYPAITAGGPNFFITAVEVDASGNTGLAYWWGSPQTSWHPETVVPIGSDWTNPAITVSNNQVIITATTSESGVLGTWAQTYGLTTWAYQQIAP